MSDLDASYADAVDDLPAEYRRAVRDAPFDYATGWVRQFYFDRARDGWSIGSIVADFARECRDDVRSEAQAAYGDDHPQSEG